MRRLIFTFPLFFVRAIFIFLIIKIDMDNLEEYAIDAISSGKRIRSIKRTENSRDVLLPGDSFPDRCL